MWIGWASADQFQAATSPPCRGSGSERCVVPELNDTPATAVDAEDDASDEGLTAHPRSPGGLVAGDLETAPFTTSMSHRSARIPPPAGPGRASSPLAARRPSTASAWW